VLAVQTDLPGHEVFYIASPDNVGGRDLAAPCSRRTATLPRCARSRGARHVRHLYREAERLLGYRPTRSRHDHQRATLIAGNASAGLPPLPLPTVRGLQGVDDTFYIPPANLGKGEPGDLMRSRAITAPLFPNATVNQIMYRSTTAGGKPVAVTGAVLDADARPGQRRGRGCRRMP